LDDTHSGDDLALAALNAKLESIDTSVPSNTNDHLNQMHQVLQGIVVAVEEVLQERNAEPRFVHEVKQLFKQFADVWEFTVCCEHGALTATPEIFMLACYYRHKWDGWAHKQYRMLKIATRRWRLLRSFLSPIGRFVARH
jgi:hypothetical protein